MSALAAIRDDEHEDDEDPRIHKLVTFGSYVRETRAHIDRMCELVSAGDESLRKDLALVAEFLWQ